MLIGVPTETTAGETRVAVTPETAKKLKAQGHTLRIQSGAGVAASVTDEAYVAAGAEITDAAGALGCDLVLKVRTPNDHEAVQMKAGAALVGMLNPFDDAGLQRLASAGLTSFALVFPDADDRRGHRQGGAGGDFGRRRGWPAGHCHRQTAGRGDRGV